MPSLEQPLSLRTETVLDVQRDEATLLRRAKSHVDEEQQKLVSRRESERESGDATGNDGEDSSQAISALRRKSFIASVRNIIEDPNGFVESRSFRNLTGILSNSNGHLSAPLFVPATTREGPGGHIHVVSSLDSQGGHVFGLHGNTNFNNHHENGHLKPILSEPSLAEYSLDDVSNYDYGDRDEEKSLF